MSGSAEPGPTSTPTSSVLLTIRGLGHVPSFKNMKRAARKGLFTEPRAKEWMRACTDSFALQLLSAFQTAKNATPTAPSRPSWIVSAVPLDDSVNEIPELYVKVIRVPVGEEGADILIGDALKRI